MASRLKSSGKVGAEEILALELQAAGYEFLREVEYAPPRKLRADFLVYGPHPYEGIYDRCPRVLVEVQGGVYDGRAHGSVTGILADIDRGNEAAIAGLFMLRFTPRQIDDGEAIPTIERYFEAAALRTLKGD